MNNLTSELTLRKISSIDFNIKTRAIHQLEKSIFEWLSTSTCGAIIYGRARIGKTRAMMCIAKSIKKKYGDDFPVISWDITDHAITEKNFYTSLLMAMGYEKIPRGSTALALKERVLNVLSLEAYNTPFKKVVIMLDEAWKFSEKDFSWLMDLYNNLNRKDILLTCFLFGTHELKDIKDEFKVQGKDQIIGRFMINEFQFYGMKEVQEMALCLISFDQMTIYDEDTTSILILDYYFPNREDKKFSTICNDFWNAFTYVRETHGVKAKDIPMKYFIDSFILMLQKYGRFGSDPKAFPEAKNLISCVELSGYGETDDEYIKCKKSRKYA